MKKSILILMAISFTTNVGAQQNKFDIALEGGPILTSLRVNESPSVENEEAITFAGGLAIQYNFPKIISFRTGISFERKGGDRTGTYVNLYDNTTGIFKSRSKFDYMTVPILIRATFGKKIKYFLHAGPNFSYLINQTNITTGPQNIEITSNDKVSYKPIDIGLAAGLGVLIPIKNSFSLSCEIRNNLGLRNISKVPVHNNGSIKTNTTGFLLGLNYKLGARSLEKK